MAREHDTQVGVMVIDLELFKEVNDTLGHHAGDNILRSVCRRLEDLMPDDATLVRFGGDEFVVLIPEAESVEDISAHARTMLKAFDQPFIEQDLDIVIGASIGVALYPEHADTAATLLQRADVAMYRAKAARAGFEVYAPELDPFTPRRLALAGQLREAIDRHQIEVAYQPQIDLSDGKVVGVEALVRWRHPTLGLLPPSEFVAAAEQTGAIKPLTLRVLDLSLGTCRAWRTNGFDLKMSVNLSVTSLLDQSLPDDVKTLLDKHGVPAESLVLELTEGSVMTESRRSVSVLAALDDMGVKLSIDDFGTGYSSMSHLRRLPISEIKIDRSFISDFTIDDHDLAIVRTTIDLGHHLGMRVVAEGAEGADALDKLRELGCDLAQGYVISRPRDKSAIDAWLATQDVARLTPPTEPTSLHERRIQRRDHA
jgi:diguanylate cyclase (GGDEF)-like protein